VSETAGVGRSAARGAAWALFSTGLAKLIALVGLTLLARLLAPREFGLLAFAMTYIVYAETIGDLGSAVALIYWPDRREEAAQVTFIINIAAGSFWCALTLFIAPFVADFFNAPHGAPIVRALAWAFVIKFAGNTHNALAQKYLRFGARAIPDLALSLIKAAISIVLAWRGFGAWSLVWGHIAGLSAWTIFLWVVVPWRPTWSWPSDLFKPMLNYGRHILFVNVIGAVIVHADLAVVGRYLGLTALGLYQMATKIPEATITIIVRALSAVLFPAFSKLAAAGEDLRGAYLISSRYVSAITMPMVVGLIILARPLVWAAFGSQWLASVPIVRVLAVLAGLQALNNYAGDILKGTGRANLIARLAVLRACLTVPALIWASHFSATAVAAALASSDGLGVIISIIITARILHMSLGSVLKAFAPSAIAAALMGAACGAWLYFTPQYGPALIAGGGVAIGAVVYLVALHLMDPALLRTARETLLVRRTQAATQ
jgi:O-antigen/teichoic acid export membrane protein